MRRRQHDAGMEITGANREKCMPPFSKAEPPGPAVLDPPTRHREPKRSPRACPLVSPTSTPEQFLDESGSPRVRLLMSVADAQALADQFSAQISSRSEQRLLDQLWLRTVLIEQHRRVRRIERIGFRLRADRLLEALDPADRNIV